MVGENASDHDVAIHLIGESRAIPLRISLESLSETGIGICRLVNARHNADKREFIRVEGALRRHGELFLPGDGLGF